MNFPWTTVSLMDEALRLKSGQHIILSPPSRKLESDLIAGFWHFASLFSCQWPAKSVLRRLGNFIISCSLRARVLIPRKAVWLVDQMNRLTHVTHGRCCFFFCFLTELTESLDLWPTSATAERKQAFTSGPHFRQAGGLRQWLERPISDADF